ncbi:MAG: copper chaperone PCu(A)C [Gammaproteobacteria bacterium]|nr:copper chaperone PCu(A)C [Gammaproteobacteria bacterium]MBU2676453.1 copper chaperone PCu(A)C [Gammaproteobacteria bacterium]NNC57929.1 copper chaperone PCu(A)C [Woeseiaceae bacterium]NNL50188.1 copper chaperone PCu(A)C [Woeseiaceae bacterium]
MRTTILLTALFIGACGVEPQPPLVATEVVVTRPMPGMAMSAAYLSLTNNTDQPIHISRVTSAQFESVQLHESSIEDGVARMRAIPVLQIPAGETATLERGGKHLMLMRPRGTFESVSLQFFDDDDLILNVDANVQAIAN